MWVVAFQVFQLFIKKQKKKVRKIHVKERFHLVACVCCRETSEIPVTKDDFLKGKAIGLKVFPRHKGML
jgi:hypothetical protein